MTTRSRNLHLLLALSVLLGWSGCSGDVQPADDLGGEDRLDSGDETKDAGHPTGDGSPPGTDWTALCATIASNVKECAPPGFASQCPAMFQNAETRGCQRFLGDLATWIQTSANPYGCQTIPGLGETPSIAASAPELAVAGDACAGAVNRTECYSVSCKTNFDCPTGSSCNDATGHCFETGSACLGLPCKTNFDCGTGATCNDALGLCIRS